jgi:hypothetical protein
MTKTAVATMPSPDEIVRSIAALSVADFAEVVERVRRLAEERDLTKGEQ